MTATAALDLARLFTVEGWLLDEDDDGLADGLAVRIVPPPRVPLATSEAAS